MAHGLNKNSLRQFPNYAAALLLPANLLITFLVYAFFKAFIPGSDQGDGFYVPGTAFIIPLLIFVGLYILGILLGILGVVMIFFGEKEPRHVVSASIGFATYILPATVLVDLIVI